VRVKAFMGSLFGQIVVGFVAGVVVGHFLPQTGPYLKPLGDLFIRAVQMVIGPIILCTVVVGIARAGGSGQIGRVGGKALIYFFAMTAVALSFGLAAGNIFRPGDGLHADPLALDSSRIAQYEKTAEETPGIIEFLVGLVPNNIVQALATGNIIQVLVFAVLLGLAMAAMGQRVARVIDGLDAIGDALLRIVGFVMRLAPLAAFGAMAFAISEFGIAALDQMAKVIACLFGAAILYVLVILWPVCAIGARLNFWKLMAYVREEIVITIGTVSSAAVLPRLLEKMERLGVARPVVGLVLPASFSFNLAGSAIYLALAPLFIAQALDIQFGWREQATMFFLLMFTSKAVAPVAGSSMVVILASLQASEVLPVAGLALILGIDRIQNEARATVNMMGNVVATAVLARTENAIDLERARRVLDGEIDVEAALEREEEEALDSPPNVTGAQP